MALSQQVLTAPPRTNSQRLAARIKALPKGSLVTVQVVIGADGEPLGWSVVSVARLEGLASQPGAFGADGAGG